MHAAEQMLVLDKFNQFTFYGYFCDFPIKSGLLGFGLIGSKGSKPFFSLIFLILLDHSGGHRYR